MRLMKKDMGSLPLPQPAAPHGGCVAGLVHRRPARRAVHQDVTQHRVADAERSRARGVGSASLTGLEQALSRTARPPNAGPPDAPFTDRFPAPRCQRRAQPRAVWDPRR
jgi:hypothetical protein